MSYYHCDKCHYTYEAKRTDACPECGYLHIRRATKSEKLEQQRIHAEILAEENSIATH